MSQLDNLNEQIKTGLTKLNQQLQESPTYAQAMDRYESLPPSSQKLVRILGVLLILFFALFYPLSQLSTSQETLASFEEKRNLIRDLFRTHREASATPNIPIPPPAETLRASINAVIARAELLPEQNLGISAGTPEGKLIPASLVASVLDVRLAKLNLRQIVDIGSSLVGISQSVKMKDMIMTANAQDTRYYDVTYKLYTLNVPEPAPEPPPEPVQNNNRNRNNSGDDGK